MTFGWINATSVTSCIKEAVFCEEPNDPPFIYIEDCITPLHGMFVGLQAPLCFSVTCSTMPISSM